MSDLFIQRDPFNSYPSDDAIFNEYSCLGPSNSVLDYHYLTNAFQVDPNFSYASCIPNENALGLYETCGLGPSEPESDWGVDLLGYPSATSTSNQTDAPLFNTSFSRQLSASDSVSDVWRPLTRRNHPFVSEEATLTGVGEIFTPHTSQTLPGCLLGPKPTCRAQGERVCAPRLLSRSASPSVRHTPYPVGLDRTRRSDSPTSTYYCQWSDGARPCGAVVEGTKHAIGEHLRATHAIRLKADKTFQVCHWERCRKSMRKESIARHVLAVHMQDKVPCPSCGSRFARTDSLQRHQRAQCPTDREASDACKTGK